MDEQLNIMKQILTIDLKDTSKDFILNRYIKKAKNIILGYCNVDSISERYIDVVIDYAVYLYKNKDVEGMLRKTEGERSIAYEEGIPANIKAALPLPKIKVGGY